MAKKKKIDVQVGKVKPTYQLEPMEIELGNEPAYDIQIGPVRRTAALAPMEFDLGPEKQDVDPKMLNATMKMIEAKERKRRTQELDARIAETSPGYDRGYEKMFYGQQDETGGKAAPVPSSGNPASRLRELIAKRDAERLKRLHNAVIYQDVIPSRKEGDGLLNLPAGYEPDPSRGKFPLGVNPHLLSDDDRIYWGI